MAKTVANTEQKFKGKKLEVKLVTDTLKNMKELRNEKRDERNEPKTISVSGLPEGSTENSVYIHFQKKKNGGGEIEKVEMLGQGKAIVVFEEPRGTLDDELLKISQRRNSYLVVDLEFKNCLQKPCAAMVATAQFICRKCFIL